ncbi:MAG: hypothetical protein DMG40_05185 [Acidobacteria bacterium]|nr:MAG: hypothetical protein DMG40_05185 [Acidobacteriota bacterium]
MYQPGPSPATPADAVDEFTVFNIKGNAYRSRIWNSPHRFGGFKQETGRGS